MMRKIFIAARCVVHFAPSTWAINAAIDRHAAVDVAIANGGRPGRRDRDSSEAAMIPSIPLFVCPLRRPARSKARNEREKAKRKSGLEAGVGSRVSIGEDAVKNARMAGENFECRLTP